MEDNLKIVLCCIPETYICCTSTTPQFFFKKWCKWESLFFPQTQRESIVPLNVMLAVFFLVTQPNTRGVPCRSLEFCVCAALFSPVPLWTANSSCLGLPSISAPSPQLRAVPELYLGSPSLYFGLETFSW